MSRAPEQAPEEIAPLFRFLWAFACIEDRHYRILWEALSSGAWRLVFPDLAALLAAVFVLFLPASPRAFAALCALSVLNLLNAAPDIANDSLLLIATSLWLLTAFGTRATRASPLRLASGAAWAFLSIAYLAAAFHKLNRGFFDPVEGCPAVFVERAHLALPWLVPEHLPFPWASATAVVLVEAMLPFLLFFPRTRGLGLALGAAFHLAVGAVVDTFSTVGLALYLLLLPRSLQERLGQDLNTFKKRYPWAGWLAAITSTSYLTWLLWLGRAGPFPDFPLTRAVWFAAAALSLVTFALWLRAIQAPVAFEPPRFHALAPVTAVLAFLLFFNSLGPYLGFRSTLAFAMFSNLRVEGRSNHYLVPKGLLQLFPESDDLAVVDWTELPPRLAARGWSMPVLELERRVLLADELGLGDKRLALHYRGQSAVLTVHETAAYLAGRDPYWKRKLFSFRAVPETEINRCLW